MRKLIAIMLGDRYGIGPEVVASFLGNFEGDEGIQLAVIGDRKVFEHARRVSGQETSFPTAVDFDAARGSRTPWCFVERPFAADVTPMGRVSAEAGREVLETLSELLDAAAAEKIDAILYGPFNKQALRDAGHYAADELDFAVNHLKHKGIAGEINTLDGLWTSRVTSHVPLKDIARHVTVDRVISSVRLLAEVLISAGVPEPRIAVAGLNPHAGDGGAFGSEEIEIISPAIKQARDAGFQVEGPFPSDTIFPMANGRGYNAIVTMYHDQGQIALKLLGFGKGVTVLAGLPVPLVTPAHGTAFDIAGKGRASSTGFQAAFEVCRQMVGRARV